MFNNGNQNKLDIKATLVDGTVVLGAIPSGLSAGLFAALNKQQPFIEIIEPSGKKRLVGLSHIVSVEEQAPFRKPELKASASANASNAYKLMGLKPGCSMSDAQKRYHQMVKQYHPDKFQAIDMPEEVSAYLAEMFQQLSTAYQIVTSQISEERAA